MDLLDSIKSDLSLSFWIISVVLLLLFIIQVLYFILVYKRPYSYEQKKDKSRDYSLKLPSVSVVIVSKNESENLKKNLPAILEQDYPDFEVVVVNMGSTDETYNYLESLSLEYPNLYHTFVPSEAENINEKKLALTLGIKAAKNDILLFTEAYCRPVSDKWIEEFACEFNKGNDVVLGYSKLDIKKRFFMSNFVQYDNLIYHSKFLSMAIKGNPFMGINRNLAYKKSLFFEEKGFSSVLSFEDGEDDLFINRIGKRRSTGVVVSPDGATETDIVNTFSVWRSLKSKYLYSKKFYEGSSNRVFGFESLTKYLFYISTVLSIVYGIIAPNYSIIVLSSLLFVIRFIISLRTVNKLSDLFNSSKVHVNLIFFELFQPFNNYKFRRRINKKKRKR